MKRRFGHWLLSALFPPLLTMPVAAGARTDGASGDLKRQSLLFLQGLDQRIADTSWRIVAANSVLCHAHTNSIGITVHDAAQYAPAYREAAVDAFGFGDGLPSVLAVAAGGPAAVAGIEPGDRIAEIDGETVEPAVARATAKEDYAPINAMMARLEAFPADRPVEFVIMRGLSRERLSVAPATVCQSRVEVVPSGKINAGSNGSTVQINSKLALWVRSDDELAIVIAHELAHNVLGHNARIDAEGIGTGLFASLGSDGRKMREMEREADRYGLLFVARAGFDYRVAPDFWRRLSNTSGLGALWATSHPAAGDRARFNQDVVAEINRQKAAGGPITP